MQIMSSVKSGELEKKEIADKTDLPLKVGDALTYHAELPRTVILSPEQRFLAVPQTSTLKGKQQRKSPRCFPKQHFIATKHVCSDSAHKKDMASAAFLHHQKRPKSQGFSLIAPWRATTHSLITEHFIS